MINDCCKMIVDIRPANCVDGNDRAIYYYIFFFRFGTVKVNILESGMALMNTMFLMVSCIVRLNTTFTQTIQDNKNEKHSRSNAGSCYPFHNRVHCTIY